MDGKGVVSGNVTGYQNQLFAQNTSTLTTIRGFIQMRIFLSKWTDYLPI